MIHLYLQVPETFLSFLFRTDSRLCIHYLSVWSDLLHNSQWITFLTQSCLPSYFFLTVFWIHVLCDSSLCTLHLSTRSNVNILHNFPWIIFPTQSYLPSYSFLSFFCIHLLCVSSLCRYHLSVWSDINFLHNFPCISFPTQSSRVLYSFYIS